MNPLQAYKQKITEIEENMNSSPEKIELLYYQLDKLEIELINKAIEIMDDEDYPEDDIDYFINNKNNLDYRKYLCEVSENILILHSNNQ